MNRALALALAAICASPAPADAATGSRRATSRDPGKGSAAAPASTEPVRHGPQFGAVLQVTAARAYLDAGAVHGLAAGQTLRLLRGGAFAGTCDVETVAPRHATCRSDGVARRGDLFRVAPPAAPPAPKPLPPVVPPEELDRRAVAVADLPQPKVEAKTAPAAAEVERPHRIEVAVSHGTWWSSGSRSWQQERLDAAVRGADAFGGLTLNADLQAVRWTERSEAARFRPNERSQLYVWEANLAARDRGAPWTGALGRVVPWMIPGATAFDGLRLGLAPSGRRGEVGVYGGLVPDPVTLALDRDRSTAGAYGSINLGTGALVARTDARAAVVTSPELGTRMEGEVRSMVLIGRSVNAEGNLRLGLGGRNQAEHAIDLAQVDVAGRPLPRLLVSGLFRYVGLSLPDVAAPAVFPGAERRWDGTVGYELGPALVTAAGGIGRDLSTGLERWWLGPELAFPHLFGTRGGAAVGYAEERGWLAGRTAWAQASVRTASRLQLTGRVAWTDDTRPGGFDDHAIDLLAGVSADLTRWLSVRASLLARVGAMSIAGSLADQAGGVTALVGIASRY